MADPESQADQVGFELSALRAYSTKPGELEGVSFWPRAAARVIDFATHFVVSTAAGFAFGIMVVISAAGHPNPVVFYRLKQTTLASFLLALLGSIAYHTICEGLHGSTLGKRLLSMTVVQANGSPCEIDSAAIRSFAYLVDALFFGLIGYLAMQKTPQEQRHGDEWADTIVCKRSKIAAHNLRGEGRFVGILLMACAADAGLIIVSFLLKLTT